MNVYTDTGFLASLFLPESTTDAAQKAVAKLREPIPLIPLTMLEMRNTFNLAVVRKRLTLSERTALWKAFQSQIRSGFFLETSVPMAELHKLAGELSDRFTPRFATRSLDLLHIAAAQILEAKSFFSFDERQRQAAKAAGLKVKP